MAHLYNHLRAAQVFGANTDVGKTIFTTALCLASSGIDSNVHYLKPVSTGAPSDADDLHISTFSPSTSSHTLFQYATPVSPHLAPSLEPANSPNLETPTSHQLLSSISSHISRVANQSRLDSQSSLYLETAGGVHSPSLSGESQASLLRPLRLPTILIGDSNLGGISVTRSAYDSLLISGYDVQAILMFPSPRWGNVDYLKKWSQKEEKNRGLKVYGLGGPNDSKQGWGEPPKKSKDLDSDREAMNRFYKGLVEGREPQFGQEEDLGGVKSVVHFLKQKHEKRIWELETLAERTRESCWWPFTQHMLAKSNDDVTVIDSAHGDFFSTYKKSSPVKVNPPSTSTTPQSSESDTSLLHPLLDGSASWWTQCFGHSPETITRAAIRASSRYGHVLFPMAANEPSLLLSERLLGKRRSFETVMESGSAKELDSPGKGWASRVFFSDDGSTGMEVALKMAIASSVQRNVNYDLDANDQNSSPTTSTSKSKEWEILGLKGSYHGDTIGAMDASEGGVYNSAVQWYKGRGHWIEPPTVGIKNGVAEITLDEVESKDDWEGIDLESISSSSSFSSKKAGKRFSITYEDVSEIYDVESRLVKDPISKVYKEFVQSTLEKLVKTQDRNFGALVLEPIVMGAGGMRFVDPLFQRILIDVVRENQDLFSKKSTNPSSASSSPNQSKEKGEWRGLPVIFDEVFVGLYRLGKVTTSNVLGTTPDISVLAKILTGGLVPMSVTLASKSIFQTFSKSDKKVEALLHGHSYTAHAVGCQVALETLDHIDELKNDEDWKLAKMDWKRTEPVGEKGKGGEGEGVGEDGIWSFWDREKVIELSKSDKVEKVMSMGTILAVELRDEEGSGGYTSTASVSLLSKLRSSESTLQSHPTKPLDGAGEGLLPFNIHARPLGNVIYFMSSLNSEKATLDAVLDVLLRELK